MIGRTIAAVCLFCAGVAGAEIRLENGCFVVHGWDGVRSPPAAGWPSVFTVSVDKPGAEPLLGSYQVDGGALLFVPRFPPQEGVAYRASLQSVPPVEARFLLPKTPRAPGRVEAVYPSASLVPENLLKLYVHFAQPMSRGEAYTRIRLRNQERQVVELPFLELEQELWDRTGKRLTLLFDPGRIKRGLVPNQEAGLALMPGREYVFEIDRQWPDATGTPLQSGFEKKFRVADADRTPPSPGTWKVEPPQAGSSDSLIIRFPEPMDHALAERLLFVERQGGASIAGEVSIAEMETVWRFRPVKAWVAGDYSIVLDKAFEDLAGNRIGRPFDVDLFEKIDREISRDYQRIPFTVR